MKEKKMEQRGFSEREMDILFRVMDNENDVTLTDGKGVVLRVSDSYEDHYGVSRKEVVGKSIYDLEEEGIFRPSVTAVVLKEQKKATIVQKNKLGHTILTTGVPIFDEGKNIQYVISFNSIDIANMETLSEKYEKLTELLNHYNDELDYLRKKSMDDSELVIKSKMMVDLKELVYQVADTSANVLITGETGVGKSVVARKIHQSSKRAEGPFIEINCGTIPSNLIESELFGYEKGAFTGADTRGKYGKIELANKGTLFLDEIGELPVNMQIKLLQVIQEKFITRIGGLKKIEVDFRLITATNRDLKKDIRNKTFREDLFYRLNVIPIDIPPLRNRPDDIVPLIVYFLEKFNKKYDRNVQMESNVFSVLEKQQWPGNIRQVENLVERLVVICKNDLIRLEDLPGDMELEEAKSSVDMEGTLEQIMEEYEKQVFSSVYAKNPDSVSVGKTLGISQSTASRKLRKYVPEYIMKKE
jgi:TyrR family helix-turn-helix protein